MQNNNPNDYLQEDEINLIEIFKFLINSKKLIIVTTLIITLLGAIYSFQKVPVYISDTLIEIGTTYDQDQDEKILIEPVKTLIQDLTINFIYRQKQDLQIKSFEDRLVRISSISNSSVTSEKFTK